MPCSSADGVLRRRSAVFETNSSSTHSLTLLADELLPALPIEIIRAGHIEVRPRKFGWEWFRYYSAANKLAYLLTQLDQGFLGARTNGSDCADLLRAHSGRSDALIARFEDQTGVAVRVHPEPVVAVDPRSAGVGLDLLRGDDPMPFILSPNSFVETGNDGWGPFRRISTDRGEELYDPAVHCGDLPGARTSCLLTLDLRNGVVMLDWSAGASSRDGASGLIDDLLRTLEATCLSMRIFSGDGAIHQDGYAVGLDLLQYAKGIGSPLRLVESGPVDLFGSDPRPVWTDCRMELALQCEDDVLASMISRLTPAEVD